MTRLEDIEHGLARLIQSAVGVLFMLVGLLITGVALAPAVHAAATHGPHTDVPLLLLGVGLSVTIFGAMALPSLLPILDRALKTTMRASLRVKKGG